MIKLEPKEQLVFDYIKENIRTRGYSPSIRDICSALNIKSTSTVHTCLERLEQKGYIQKEGGKSRTVRIEGIGAYGDALVLPYSVEWLVIAGESSPSRIDTRDVEVIEIPSAEEMRPFIWNTSPAWPLGGGEATRSARLVCAPLSAPDAEPGDAGAFVRTFGSGEGLYDWRRHDKGYYRVSLEFTTNGVVDAKATLSRVVYLGFTAWNGQAIIVR